MRYVVGFAFTKDLKRVLLINKNKPEWQKGLLNGVGGKIEGKETPLEAMRREAIEEVGIDVDWQEKGCMLGTNNDSKPFECWIFYAYDDKVIEYIQLESETPSLYRVNRIEDLKTVANLKFLVPFGICKDHSQFITIDYQGD